MALFDRCHPERAARLFGCEVGDIYGWAGIGAFNLYLDASGVAISTGESLLAKIVTPGADFKSLRHNAKCTPLEEFGSQTQPQIPALGRGLLGSFLKSPETQESPLPQSSEQPIGRLARPSAYRLNGMWRLPAMLPRSWQYGGNIELFKYDTDEPEIMFLLADVEGKDAEYVMALNIKIDVATLRQWTFILREDLALIQQRILSGTPFSIKTDDKEQDEMALLAATETPKIHGNAKKNAEKRKRVLKAAFVAEEKWPDECLTYQDWGYAIDNHGHELFGEACPMKPDYIARLLSKAIRGGTLSDIE